jgi:1,4-dihydroxy-2-naphthoyl-CoA synthase
MSEPVKLVTKPSAAATIQASVVALLCEALADAEAGKVSGVIIISKEIDGSWYHRASGALSVREEIGAIEILKNDRIRRTEEIIE